jgi:hypothetical protein
MPELERTLTRLGRELEYPPTPDLATAVVGRLRAGGAAAPAEERPRVRRRLLVPPGGLRRALVLALVATLLLAGTVVAAVPSVRDAVLEFFGLQGATVERTTTLPTPPAERPLDLGRRTSLAAASDRLAFVPLLPADPGEPDAVYTSGATRGGELALAYRPRPGLPRASTTGLRLPRAPTTRPGLPRVSTTRLGLLVTEFRGDFHPDFVGKLAGPRTRIERLRVDGRPAIWIEGAQHFFFYRDEHGNIVERELRLAQNVLLVEYGRVLVRLEGAFHRQRAIAIARSLRPAVSGP